MSCFLLRDLWWVVSLSWAFVKCIEDNNPSCTHTSQEYCEEVILKACHFHTGSCYRNTEECKYFREGISGKAWAPRLFGKTKYGRGTRNGPWSNLTPGHSFRLLIGFAFPAADPTLVSALGMVHWAFSECTRLSASTVCRLGRGWHDSARLRKE